MKRLKVTKILGDTVKLVLKVENCPDLELKLAWTMSAVILIENRLRGLGCPINALQDPSVFWTSLDCTKLTLGVWATALQEQPEFGDEDGFDTIASYLTPANYGDAALALKAAFLESLSKEQRDDIKRREEDEKKGEKVEKQQTDPTLAQT